MVRPTNPYPSAAKTTTYSIVSTNDLNCKVVGNYNTGAAAITVNPIPTFNVAGSPIVQDNVATPFNVQLTGLAPWTFTYSTTTLGGTLTNTVTSNTITGINAAPYVWNITSNYSVPTSSLGSLNFDWVGNSRLDLSPGITIGSSAFTVDGWFYFTSTTNSAAIIGSSNSFGLSVFVDDNKTILLDPKMDWSFQSLLSASS
jgi:hypothetical protein